MTEAIATLGVILAGGRARRMGGGDKTMRAIAGRPVLDHVIERFKPQCETLILNANGDPARFAAFGLPVVSDEAPDFAGPLAGVLAALDWSAIHYPHIEWVASVAADCPFLPLDLVARMQAERSARRADLAVASSDGRDHPVIGLWKVSLRHDLRHALVVEERRKVSAWTSRHKLAMTQWPVTPVDPFFNINTKEDLAQAQSIYALNAPINRR